MITKKEEAFNRIETVSILNKPDMKEQLVKNLKRNTLGFLLFHSSTFDDYLNARYLPPSGYPILPIFTVFYIIGLIVSIKKYPYYLTFYLFALLPVQILSQHTPDASRSVHLVPIIFFFIFLGLHTTSKLWDKYFPKSYFSYFILIISIVTAFYSTFSYFSWITDNKTVSAREPAISVNEYNEWKNALIQQIQQTGYGFTVGDWKLLHKRKDIIP
jgi:hypothetical protein